MLADVPFSSPQDRQAGGGGRRSSVPVLRRRFVHHRLRHERQRRHGGQLSIGGATCGARVWQRALSASCGAIGIDGSRWS